MSAILSEKTSSDMNSHTTSQSLQLQGQLEAILVKLKTDPASVTTEEAHLLSENVTASDERAGSSYTQAPHRSLLTAVKDLHAAVDGSPDEVTTDVIRIAQSIVSKMQNIVGHANAPHPEVEAELQEKMAKVGPKIAQGTVGKAEVNQLHFPEACTHGYTDKGGITAAAQSVVARHERKLSSSGDSQAALHPSSGHFRSKNKSPMSPEQRYQHDRENNRFQAKSAVKHQVEDGIVSKAEADHLHSLESRAHRSSAKGEIAATAQSTTVRRDSNAGGQRPRANSRSALSPQEQSHHDKEENLRQAEVAIRPKVEDGTVTAAEAHKLQSREMRAHGHVEKGGLSATAQSIVAKRHQEACDDVSNSKAPMNPDSGHRKEEDQIEGNLGDSTVVEQEAY